MKEIISFSLYLYERKKQITMTLREKIAALAAKFSATKVEDVVENEVVEVTGEGEKPEVFEEVPVEGEVAPVMEEAPLEADAPVEEVVAEVNDLDARFSAMQAMIDEMRAVIEELRSSMGQAMEVNSEMLDEFSKLKKAPEGERVEEKFKKVKKAVENKETGKPNLDRLLNRIK